MNNHTAAELTRTVYRQLHQKAPPWLDIEVGEEPKTNNLHKWLKVLNQFSHEVDLHFTIKYFSPETLKKTVESTGIPTVVFMEQNGLPEPVLLIKQGKKLFKMQMPFAEMQSWDDQNTDAFLLNNQLEELANEAHSGNILGLVPLGLTDKETIIVGTKTPFKRFVKLLRTERKNVWQIYIYAILAGLLSLTLPLGVQSVVGLISGGMLLRPVILLTIFVVLGVLLTGFLQVMQISVVEMVQQRIFARTAINFAHRIPKIKLQELAGVYAPELVNRFFDILTVQKSLTKILVEFVTAVLQIIFGLLLLSIYHPFFILFGLTLMFILFIIFYFTGKKGLSSSLEESKYKYRIAHWLEELARNLTTFKIAGTSKLPLDRMQHYLSGYLERRKAHFKVLILQYKSFVLFKTFVVGGLLALGAFLVLDQQITVGQFVAAEIVIVTIIGAIEKLILRLDVIYDILTAVEKLGNVTDLELENQKGLIHPVQQDDVGLRVKVHNLNYNYENGKVNALHNVSFSLAPCESMAIIGSEGSGKTTLMHVLAGMLDVYTGQVVYNGFSLHDINLESLRNHVGDSLYHEHIFSASVFDNLTVGRPNISYEDISKTLEITELCDYVNELPKGLHTELTAAGEGIPNNISKKIVLTRSLLGNPKLLLFDDFFFNLETAYKLRLLQKVLIEKTFNATIIASSHDPIVLKSVDHILLLRNGEVAQIGKFDEIKHNPFFKTLIYW